MAKSFYNIPTNPNAVTNPALSEAFKKSGLAAPEVLPEEEAPAPEQQTPSFSGGEESYPQQEQDQPEDWSAVMENQQPRGSQGGPQAFRDVDDEAYMGTLRVPDVKGNVLSREEVLEMEKSDRARDMRSVGIFSASYEDAAELKSQFGSAVGTKDVVTILGTARRLGESLAEMSVSGDIDMQLEPGQDKMSGLDLLKTGFNSTATEVTRNLVATAAMTLPVLSGNMRVSLTDENGQEDASSLKAFLGGDFTFGTSEKETKLTKEAFIPILGHTFAEVSKLSKNVTDEQGRPIDPKSLPASSVSSAVSGMLIYKALENRGILVTKKDENGVEQPYLSPIVGHDTLMATHGMAAAFGQAKVGKSTTTPGTNTGESKTAQRITRHGDLDRKNKEKVDKVSDSKIILNRTPLVTSPTKAWIAGMLFSEAKRSLLSNDPVALKNAAAVLNVELDEPPREPSKYKQYQAEMMQKISKAMRSLQGFSEHLKVGSPRFNTWWEDYVVHRLYADSNDANMQRDLIARASIGAVEVPFSVSSTPAYHKTGISSKEAAAYWTDIKDLVEDAGRESYHLESDRMKEMSFLLTVAHALDIGKTAGGVNTTKSTHPRDWLTLMTPEFMAKAASIGSRLQTLIPSSSKDIAMGLSDPAKIPVTPEQRVILNELLSGSDKKTWGFKAQAYLDMARYVDAKNRGIPFTPRVTTAIDMNSAGRAFQGMDIGSRQVAERVGLEWQRYYDDRISNALPHGSPRTYFVGVAIDLGVDKAIGKADPDLSNDIKRLLEEYSEGDVAFIDDFGKKVLLTSDYGKSILFHYAEARSFLRKHPEFASKFKALFNSEEEAVAAINNIYKHTLQEATSVWQQAVPKDITKVLHMLGTSPEPTGYFGEKMGVGGFISQPIGKSVRIQGEGIDQVIQLEKMIRSIQAKAKDKGYIDEETGKPVEAPGEGSFDINQIGPMLGQYRESAVVIETMTYLNKNKNPDKILFAQPVFDNFILNAGSFAQYLYTANNIFAPKVFGWDIQTAFKDDYLKQITKVMSEVQKAGEADIGKAGKFYGTTMTLDREYKYLSESETKLSPVRQAFLDFLNSPSSGYIPPSADRKDSNVISFKEFSKLVVAFQQFKLYYYEGGARKSSLHRWITEGLEVKEQVMRDFRKVARNGDVLFMT